MASAWPGGTANSTNSKPSIPIGFSKVVTCMPGFILFEAGWALMEASSLGPSIL